MSDTFAIALSDGAWSMGSQPRAGITFGDDNGDTYRIDTVKLSTMNRRYIGNITNVETGKTWFAEMYRAI